MNFNYLSILAKYNLLILKINIMTYQFKIQIKGITHPPVWRRVIIPAKYNFLDLHNIIQVSFGWYNAHLYQFSPTGYGSRPIIKESYDDDFFEMEEILEPEDISLSKIFKKEKQKFTYIYDFGDDWIHTIILEKILPDLTMYPKLIAGKGQCPPEDCGGIWGYENLKKVLSDSKDPEYEEMAEWIGLEHGELWDKKEFDLISAQADLLFLYSRNN